MRLDDLIQRLQEIESVHGGEMEVRYVEGEAAVRGSYDDFYGDLPITDIIVEGKAVIFR